MKNFCFWFSFLFMCGISLNSFAQKTNGTIRGVVTSNKNIQELVSISLLSATDTAVLKLVVTDKTGQFELKDIQFGKYRVTVTAVGFEKTTTPAFEISTTQPNYLIENIELKAAPKSLQNVLVSSKKQMIEQTLDKTIINVDASPTNAGLTALEVLEKSPGISVDKDGNISLKGKQGVMVMMDGKPTYLSAADLTNLLKNMPASQLEQIEIMSNPPAKYDAAGNSGIINIKTKRSKTQGFNGSLNLGAGHGFNPKTNNSLALNYRTGKFNFFTNYSHNWNKGRQHLDLKRVFPDTLFDQISRMEPNYQNHNYKIGADFFASKKTTLGVVLTGFENPGSMTNNNTTYKRDKSGNLLSRTETISKNTDHWTNKSLNLNMRHVIDSTGKEISADVDYLRYTSNNQQNFSSYFFDKTGSKSQTDEFLSGKLPSDIKIYSAKVDYSHPLKGKAKFEAGVKSSYVETDNDAQYATLVNDSWSIDRGRSNHFKYKENINAAYVNTSKEFNKKWSGQLGLRLENTNAKGNQVTTGEVFNRNYTQLFPTAYLGYKQNDKNQFALSYGRRIGRPNYQDMNPFYYFLDKYTYQVGNPYLRPQFSHNIELSHSWNSILNSSIGYSKTNDIMQEVLEQIDSISTSFVKRSNLAKQNSLSLSVSANIPVTKWWRANIYTNVFRNQFKGVVNNGPIDVSGTTGMANFSNSFTFKRGWGAEISGFYRTKAIEGTLVANDMGGVNIAFSKQVLKKKGNLRLNITDILYTQQFSGYSKYQNIDVTIKNSRDSRVANLSFTYRFGKQQNTPQRKKGGAGDEQERVKVGGN